MSITVKLNQELVTQLHQAAEREGIATDDYVAKVLQRYLAIESLALPNSEALLLQQINIGLSEATWQRYHHLAQKLHNETLQADEQRELILIRDQIEKANVQRIEALIKLAQIRKTTLDTLIHDLGLRPAAYA